MAKYIVRETIDWEIEADTPEEALRAFMDATPQEQYGQWPWSITERVVIGVNPNTGLASIFEAEDLESLIAQVDETR